MKIITPYKFYMTQNDKDQLTQYLKYIDDLYFDFKGKDNADEHFFDGLRTQTKRVLDNTVVIKGWV